MDQTFQFIGVLQPDGTVIEVNRAALALGGLQREEIVGRKFWETRYWSHSAEERLRLQQAVARAAQGETVRYEVELRVAADRMARVDFSLKPVRNERGAVTALIPEGRDVTKYRNVVDTLERSEDALRRFYAIATDSYASSEDKYRSMLALGAELLDLPWGFLGRAHGHRYQILCSHGNHPSLHADTEFPIAEHPARGALLQPDVTQVDVAVQEGQKIAASLKRYGLALYVGVPLRAGGRTTGLFEFAGPDSRGKPVSSTIIELLKLMAQWLSAEIERRLAEGERETLLRELTLRNAEMENFVYTISHDLKTPLVSIGGFASLASKDLERGDLSQTRDSLMEITKATEQMSALLQDLLSLSRSGRLLGALELTDLSALLADVLTRLRDRIDDSHACLNIADDLPQIYADRSRLAQVFFNVLDNALKFRQPGVTPRIDVGWERRGDDLCFFVRDNGRGIKPEYQQRIFGLFQRADTSIEGTGVGLAIARRVIEVHGGNMWVESEPGRGSTFWISLPDSAMVNSRASAEEGRR